MLPATWNANKNLRVHILHTQIIDLYIYTQVNSPVFYFLYVLRCQGWATEESWFDSRQVNGKKGNIVAPSALKSWRYIARVEVQLHSFLPWALEGCELTSRPDSFFSTQGPWYQLNWRLAGPRACQEVLEKRIFSCLCRDSNPDRPRPDQTDTSTEARDLPLLQRCQNDSEAYIAP